ncbi:uncharacterized protein [Littorina saxatilis]|uniref:Uncharacterized protein n=2 Tax=Littorina saxatilis TaxID=31220 RepID=A0AAN9BZ52_9CAEN
MAELEDGAQGDPSQALEESDDVRRIKEEWTRLQMAADGGGKAVTQGAGTHREELQKGAELRKADGTKTKMPPSRLPSLDSMIGRIPSIPSMEISSGFGKKLPELGSVGHRLGIIADSRDLEPQGVVLEKTTYIFSADTPTQTDIKWSAPANAGVFKSLTYNIEVDGGQGWVALTDNCRTILRAYFTSDKLLLGRFSRTQEAEPVAVRLRIRATGTVKHRNQEETVSGPWSDEIWLSIEGSSVTSNTAV